MPFCPKCENDTKFYRVINGMKATAQFRKGRWTASNWVNASNEDDGFYCGHCNCCIKLKDTKKQDKWIEECDLYRTPLPPFIYKGDAFIEDLEKIGKNRDLKIQKNWRESKAPKRMHLDIIKLGISKDLVALFKASPAFGIDVTKDLYTHQVEAISHVLKKKNVIITTPTASGKSLCYFIPILNDLLNDENATALMIFPAKALIQDQLEKLLSLGDETAFQEGRFEYDLKIGKKHISVGVYTGDITDGRDQQDVREKARIIFSTPDSLHAKILPFLRGLKKAGNISFIRFFENLRYVVIDEVHTYRGVFGANLAYLMRRMRLICEKLDNTDIQFILCSATIANASEHSKDLIDLPFQIINNDGAEEHRKDFVLWNPPKAKKATQRLDPQTEALEILKNVVYTKNRTPSSLIFVRSIRGTEKFIKTLRNVSSSLKLTCLDRLGSYHSFLSGKDRRSRENEIKSRQILCTASTNALELGIDIGDLNFCMILGFPGTVASTLQQAGRVGRKGDGTVVLILGDNPLEQHLARNPEYFFKKLKNPEIVRIPLKNPNIIKTHLLCHLAESKYLVENEGAKYSLPSDFQRFFGNTAMEQYQNLLKENKVDDPRYRNINMLWRPSIQEGYKEIYYTLRAVVGRERFNLNFEEKHEEIMPVVDESRAGLFFFKGAVWLQDGKWYKSEGLNYKNGIINLNSWVNDDGKPDDPPYETFAVPSYKTTFDANKIEEKQSKKNWFTLKFGPLNVERYIKNYLEVPINKGKSSEEKNKWRLIYDVKSIDFDTEGLGLVLTEEGLKEFIRRYKGEVQAGIKSSLHAVEHAIGTILPLYVRCDTNDISYESSENHQACDNKPAIIFFDNQAGGLGLVRVAYNSPVELFEEAHAFLKACKCTDGCPECLHLPKCERKNEDIDKQGALIILSMLKEVWK